MIVSTSRWAVATRALRATQGLIGVQIKRQFPAPPCTLGCTLGYFAPSQETDPFVSDAVVAAVLRCLIADAGVAAVLDDAVSTFSARLPIPANEKARQAIAWRARKPQDDWLTR